MARVEKGEVFRSDEEHGIDYETEGADVGTIPVGVPPLFSQVRRVHWLLGEKTPREWEGLIPDRKDRSTREMYEVRWVYR